MVGLNVAAPMTLLFMSDVLYIALASVALLDVVLVLALLRGRMVIAGLLISALGLVLLLLFDNLGSSQERINPADMDQIFTLIIGVLVLLVTASAWQLFQTYRASRSIRTRLNVAFIGVALVPIVFVSAISIALMWTVASGQIIDQLDSVVRLKQSQLSTWVDTLQTDLAGLRSQQDSPLRLSLDQNTSSETIASRMQDTLRDIFGLSITDTQRFSELLVLDSSGQVVTGSSTARQGEDHSGEPYFTDQVHAVTTPYFSESLNAVVIVFSEPVYDRHGEWMGVLAGVGNLDLLDAVMAERTGLGDTGETYLVGSDRTLLTPSRFEGYDTITTTVDTQAVQTILDENRLLGEGAYTSYHEERVYGVYRWIPELETILIAEQQESEALSDVLTVVVTNVVVAGVTIGLAMGMALLVTRGLAAPLAALTRVASQVAGGDLDAQVPVQREDEIGQLAESFNSMTDSLRGMVDSERVGKFRLEKTVAQYTDFVQQVADGDLTQQLALDGLDDTDDLYRLGDNLNRMVERLHEMADQVRGAAAALAQAASEIGATASQQASTALEQDAAVTQTVATVEEVRMTVGQTAQNAQQVAGVSRQSLDISRLGETSVSDTIDGMIAIRSQVDDIAETILALSERTQRIGQIINTVNAISDRSTMLALNASIEAARAGEEGKGFAVVAMEVRQLADQSREATDSIQSILDEIQQTTNSAVMVTEEGSKGVTVGMDLAERAGESIKELAAILDSVQEAADRIAANTAEQSQSMDQLVSAMLQIQQASAQTTSGIRQTETSVHDLAGMAHQLDEAAMRYKLRDG